jgi:penicillin amidase
LNPPARSLAGDGDTVQANGLVAPLGPAAAYGALARYAFDVGCWENSRWSVFLGASGHPASPHYADQHAGWAACRMTPMLAEWSMLEATCPTRQHLLPPA